MAATKNISSPRRRKGTQRSAGSRLRCGFVDPAAGRNSHRTSHGCALSPWSCLEAPWCDGLDTTATSQAGQGAQSGGNQALDVGEIARCKKTLVAQERGAAAGLRSRFESRRDSLGQCQRKGTRQLLRREPWRSLRCSSRGYGAGSETAHAGICVSQACRPFFLTKLSLYYARFSRPDPVKDNEACFPAELGRRRLSAQR